jgi:hypothetical protein
LGSNDAFNAATAAMSAAAGVFPEATGCEVSGSADTFGVAEGGLGSACSRAPHAVIATASSTTPAPTDSLRII